MARSEVTGEGPAPARGGHGGNTGTTTYTGTLGGPVLAVDKNGNGQVNYGDTITFNVASTAPYPYVDVKCSQNGTPVWETVEGFFIGWMWGRTYYLLGG